MTLPPLRPIRSQMSMADLEGMKEYELWQLGLYREGHKPFGVLGKGYRSQVLGSRNFAHARARRRVALQ